MLWSFVKAIGSFLISVAALSSAAHAAFVNNVEHFDGTQKDLTTWADWSAGGSTSQSNQLFMFSMTGRAEYRARYATVGVGGFVQVKARLNSISADGGQYFLALNTTPYDNVPVSASDRSVALEPRSLGSNLVAGSSWYGNGRGTGADGVYYALQPPLVFPTSQDFILRIDYLAPTSVQYSTFDTAM